MRKLRMSPRKVLIVVAGLLMAVGFVNAQNVSSSSFDVPFQFSINNMVLPAGTYLVQRANTPMGDPAMLSIRQANRKGAAQMFITNAVESTKSSEQPKLVFNCYGSDCFLSQVWAQDENIGRKTTASRRELLLAKESPAHRVVLVARLHQSK